MLSRIAAFTAALTMSAGVLAATAAPAQAEDHIYCPPTGGDCYVVVTSPGSSGSSGNVGSSGNFQCTAPAAVWGCSDPLYGWFNPTDDCYWQRVSPQPPASDPVWNGNYPSGAIYNVWCAGYITATGNTWRASAPPGYGGRYDYLLAAARAVSRLGLRAPAIGIVPEPGGEGRVGLPVWMWTETGPSTWARPTPTVSASAGGITVSARANATQIVWTMGDGTTVTCANPGTPYTVEAGSSMSPTCGHRYREPSTTRRGGTYPITATTTWEVQWWVSGGGAGVRGTLTVDRQSTTAIRVGQLRVVTSS
jgi:hypothetical protein